MSSSTAGAAPPVRTGIPQLGRAVPQLPARHVPRPRLERLLEAAVDAGTVIVSAPAGSGKTLLLASWAAHTRRPVGWLSLEPEDGDPQHFWSRLLQALRAAGDVPGGSLLATVQAPPTHDPRFVRLLIDACNQVPEPRVLVLEDLQVLSGTAAMTTLERAVRHGLGNLRLVIGTRSDPRLPLQRLRLEGRLTEIRAADLAFNGAEARSLLAEHDVALAPQQLETLVERTEGWAAGLRLATLALQVPGDAAATVADLVGEQRNVADYFLEEVLEGQDPDLTRFLLETCVVRRVCGDLADALTGRDDGRQLLARLDRENLFVVALDDRREWYRYHQLFADLLRHRLLAQDRDHARALHRRAADWFAREGEVVEACRHLSAAEDWDGLARFVLRTAGAQLLGADRSVVAALLDDVPAAVVNDSALVSTAAAVAGYARYDVAAILSNATRARELVHTLAPADLRVTEAVLTTLDAVVAWIEADAELQVTASLEAVRRLDRITPAEMPAAPVYKIAAMTIHGMGCLWTGRLGEAERTLSDMTAALASAAAMTPVIALHLHGSMAVLKAMGGHLRDARREVDRALTIAEDSGWLFLPLSAMTYVAESLVRLLEADSEGCAVALERGRACIGSRRDRHAETALTLAQARLHTTDGRPGLARRAVEDLEERSGDWPMPTFLRQWAELVEAEILLSEGRTADAIGLMSPASHEPARRRPHAQRVATLARGHLLDNDPRQCLAVLHPLLVTPPTDLGPASDVWMLAALAHDKLRREAEAQECLSRSIDVAAPEGILRPYVVAGDRVGHLLRGYRRIDDSHEHFVAALVDRLSGDAAATDGSGLSDPLTQRERSVLLLLPTMMSNAEIAEELFVSVNTVKVHLKSVYRKLGVTSRRQAVSRARELGLGGRAAAPARTRTPV